MKAGAATPIAATYAEDAVDCDAAGECTKGRAHIEEHLRNQMQSLGRAQAATVKSAGSTQTGDFVYEWGRAEAVFAGGKTLGESYVTVWQKQADGQWKIFRNLVIPTR